MMTFNPFHDPIPPPPPHKNNQRLPAAGPLRRARPRHRRHRRPRGAALAAGCAARVGASPPQSRLAPCPFPPRPLHVCARTYLRLSIAGAADRQLRPRFQPPEAPNPSNHAIAQHNAQNAPRRVARDRRRRRGARGNAAARLHGGARRRRRRLGPRQGGRRRPGAGAARALHRCVRAAVVSVCFYLCACCTYLLIRSVHGSVTAPSDY